MTLYLDASALVALHIETPARSTVREAMTDDRDWCTSALTLVEALALIDRVTDESVLRDDLEDHVRLTWDRLAVVPTDPRPDTECPERATKAANPTAPIRLAK